MISFRILVRNFSRKPSKEDIAVKGKLRCIVCFPTKNFNSPKQVTQHYKTNHKELFLKNCKCDKCGNLFPDGKELGDHKKESDKKSQNYCVTKGFRSFQHFKDHHVELLKAGKLEEEAGEEEATGSQGEEEAGEEEATDSQAEEEAGAEDSDTGN